MDERNYWQRTRLSRRGLIASAGVGAAGTAAMGLVGCGGNNKSGSSTTSPSGTAAAPKKGGEITASVGAPTTQSLDPHTTVNLAFSYWGYISNMFILADPKTITPFKGELIESWEQVDKTTMTFKVRQGVNWHEGKVTNGRAFDANDLAFNLMRIAGKLDPTRSALYQRASDLAGMDKAEATDANTVKVTFSKPNSAFIAGLSDWRNWAVPKELVDKDPLFQDPSGFTGTGPFTVDKWDSATLTGHYKANPKYWKKGQPYLDGVQQRSYADSASTLAAFISGQIDVTAAQVAVDRDTIQKSLPKANIVSWENVQWEMFMMNQSRDVFKDPRVRNAIFYAIDYTSLLDQELGKGTWDFTNVLVSGLPGAPTADQVAKTRPWDPTQKDKDITDAKALMTQAGHPDGGISFSIVPIGNAGAYLNYSVRLQDQLTKIWPAMKVTINPPADSAAATKTLSTGDYDMFCYTAAPPVDAIFDPVQRLYSTGSRNYTKLSDPKIDQLVDQILAEFDANARNPLFGQLTQAILNNLINIPVGKPKEWNAVQPRVQGFGDLGGPGATLYPYAAPNWSDSLWISG